VRGTLGFNNRRVNGYGHQFTTLLRASKINSSLAVNYIIPGLHPSTDKLIFSIGAGRLSYNQKNEQSNSLKVSAAYTTALSSYVQQTIALTYLNERYNLKGLPKTNARILYPSIRWESRYADKDLNPNNGYALDLSMAGAPDGLTSTTGFTQARINLKTLLTFFNNTRLLVRGSYGRTNIKQLEHLPLSLQLVAGGARSIRGYGYNAIGPGKNLIVGSAEIQQRVYGEFYIAAFFDMGTVGDKVLSKHINEGVGPAIVWLSPVGAVELSVARAIREKNKPWMIQFSMGPEI
jgi:translocation and assembly module TamA